MEKIILKKRAGRNSYSLVVNGIVKAQHEILTALLMDDISFDCIALYRSWLLRNPGHAVCANATCVGQDANSVYIGFSFESEGNPELVLSKSVFLYILDQWEKVSANKPDQIIITLNDDKTVTFEQIFEQKE